MEENETVAANVEEVATPVIENEGTEPEVTVENPEGLEGTTEPSVKKDVTETQAFAQRLKEQTAKSIDEEYSRLYGVSHGIHSKAEYDIALEKQNEEQRRIELEEKGYDPNVIDEYMNKNPVFVKAQEYMNNQEKEKFKNNDNVEFLTYFEKENKRPFDGEKDVLPQEVWDMSQKYQNSLGKEGRSLVEAYQKHENSLLKARIADYEKGNVTNATNLENAANSTGSVTGNGASTDKPLTKEMIETMNPKDIAKRWKEVKQIYKMQ